MRYCDLASGPELDLRIFTVLQGRPSDDPLPLDAEGYCTGDMVDEDVLYCDTCNYRGSSGDDPDRWANAHKPVIPAYSTDAGAAWELVEALRELGVFLAIEVGPERVSAAIYRGARGEPPIAALGSDQPFASVMARVAWAALQKLE